MAFDSKVLGPVGAVVFPEQDGLIQSELQKRQPRVAPAGCTGILWESCHQPQEHSHQHGMAHGRPRLPTGSYASWFPGTEHLPFSEVYSSLTRSATGLECCRWQCQRRITACYWPSFDVCRLQRTMYGHMAITDTDVRSGPRRREKGG